jgi:hypothetical protein
MPPRAADVTGTAGRGKHKPIPPLGDLGYGWDDLPTPDQMDAFARTLKASPQTFLHGLDVGSDRASFVWLDREALRRASFLDERVLGGDVTSDWRTLGEVEAAVRDAALDERCHFIFHIGHVGSTLLSRLLDADTRLLGLREPLALRVLAQVHPSRGPAPPAWTPEVFERRLGACLALWSRTFAPDQTSVIKATSYCSEMAAGILARPVRPRAIFMFTPPEPYLATLFAGANNRIDVMAMVQSRAERLNLRLGGETVRLSDMSYPQIAAMGWAAEMTALAAADGPAALWLDFERFLLRPQARLKAAFAHFGIDAPDEAVAAVIAGPDMARYSKAPEHAYDADLRSRLLADARVRHEADIREGLDWLERAGAAFPEIAAVLDRAASP